MCVFNIRVMTDGWGDVITTDSYHHSYIVIHGSVCVHAIVKEGGNTVVKYCQLCQVR